MLKKKLHKSYATIPVIIRLYLKSFQIKKHIMMKRAVVLLVIMSLAYGISAGQTVKETRNVKGFTTVGFGIAGNLYVKIGPEFSVVLEGEENDLEEVVTELSGDRLQIKQENWRFNFNEKVNVYITMPGLEGLGVSGSGRAEILDAVTDADDLNLSVSGSGKLLTARLEVDELDCSISGSGNIVIGSAGNADRAEISISGSGGYSGEEFEIDHLDISVSGSGNCICKVGDSLEATISGSGNVTYIGDPKIDARVSGSGHVRAAK